MSEKKGVKDNKAKKKQAKEARKEKARQKAEPQKVLGNLENCPPSTPVLIKGAPEVSKAVSDLECPIDEIFQISNLTKEKDVTAIADPFQFSFSKESCSHLKGHFPNDETYRRMNRVTSVIDPDLSFSDIINALNKPTSKFHLTGPKKDNGLHSPSYTFQVDLEIPEKQVSGEKEAKTGRYRFNLFVCKRTTEPCIMRDSTEKNESQIIHVGFGKVTTFFPVCGPKVRINQPQVTQAENIEKYQNLLKNCANQKLSEDQYCLCDTPK